MRSLNRICIVLVCATSLAGAAAEKTFVISGHTGVSGVRMIGLPGNVVSDENGQYRAEVAEGWSGRIMPVKEGHRFNPPQRFCKDIDRDCTGEDYVASVLTFVISGNAGVAGAKIQGLPEDPMTDENGAYSVVVTYGWSGTATPVKKGYRFEPPRFQYHRVTANQTAGNYSAKMIEYTIAGSVGLPGVAMRGLPGNPVTDENGVYSAEVAYGWSGTVAPAREGYCFQPAQRRYQHVTASQTDGNYSANMIEYTIAGTVGLPGVAMQGLPGAPLTDGNGVYQAKVPYSWSGTVTPIKAGYTFDPPQKTYVKVRASLTGQDYAVARVSVDPSLPDGTGRLNVLLIPSGAVGPQVQVEVQEDMLVMLQILRDRLSEPRMILGILYDYGDIFAGGDQDTRAFYLEGYGVLFVLEVDFPLLLAEPNAPEEEPKRDIDPVWLRARQRLRAPGRGSAYSQRPSDEVSFEQLKTDLIETLKHTANIRHIDPNEQVIFTIVSRTGAGGMSGSSAGYFSASGGGWGAGNSYSYSVGGFNSGGNGAGARIPLLDKYGQPKRDALGNTIYQPAPTPPAQPVPGPTSVLTIRAKKADVNAYAAGQVDLEQFQQRVTVFNY